MLNAFLDKNIARGLSVGEAGCARSERLWCRFLVLDGKVDGLLRLG